MPESRQLFKIRRIGKNAEQVLHAPSMAAGYYEMEYDEKTGVIRYFPVKRGIYKEESKHDKN